MDARLSLTWLQVSGGNLGGGGNFDGHRQRIRSGLLNYRDRIPEIDKPRSPCILERGTLAGEIRDYWLDEANDLHYRFWTPPKTATAFMLAVSVPVALRSGVALTRT